MDKQKVKREIVKMEGTKLKAFKRTFETRPQIEIQDKVEYHCPVGENLTKGKVNVKYVPEDLLLEFESFREYLGTIDNGTVESVGYKIFQALNSFLKPRKLRVEVQGSTEDHGTARATFAKPLDDSY